MKREIPEKCTLCGGGFEHNGKRAIFPYPPKHYLCFPCFTKSLDAGLNRLNKVLAGAAPHQRGLAELQADIEHTENIDKP